MKMNRHFLAIFALFTIGLAVRCLPLLISPLPFNIDGFPLVRISEDIIESGHWSLSYPKETSDLVTYNAKMPVISMIISFFSLIFGKTPLETTQFVIPFLSSCSIVILYLVTFRLTRNELVSFLAGLALALNGFFVYLGAAVMKETIGLVILILAIFLFNGRNDPRKRLLAAFLFLLLTMTHHLTVWIAFTMISLIVLAKASTGWYHGSFKKRDFIIDIAAGPFLFIFTIIYYEFVDLGLFNKVSNLNDIALFSSIFLLGAIVCHTFSIPKKRKRPKNIIKNKTLIIPIGAVIFLAANHFTMLFPGTIRTSSAFLMYLIPYILLCSIGIIGINVIANRKTEYKPFIASLFLAPFLVILYALLKGFDAFTFILIYRTYDYIDFGLAICAGIGAGYIIKRAVKPFDEDEKTSFRIKASISIMFLVICLLTVPLAFQGQDFYGVQDATNEYEFEAMGWLGDNFADNKISTDERLNDISAPYFDLHTDITLPWKLKYGRPVDSGTVLFMEDKWKTVGAQMSPMEPIKISEGTYERTIANNDLIYSTGGSVSQVNIVVVR